MNAFDNKKGYINKQELTNLFAGKEIFVYGVGVDSEVFLNDYDHRISVKGFVDSYRFGNEYLGKKVISPEQYFDNFKNIPLVVMVVRYVSEICKQLEKMGLRFSHDFFVYDNDFCFHPDQITEDFIKFNEKRWKPYKVVGKTNRKIVLIPFDMRHSAYDLIRSAYISNYDAKETDAQIFAYMRYGIAYENASENFKRIYQSLNVTEIVNTCLSVKQKEIVKELVNTIWGRIHTWADWNSITIYGISFGYTILGHMMRHIIPPLDANDEKLKSFLETAIECIIFWYDFFNSYDVQLVMLGDGVDWDGYIREIAISHGVPTYSSTEGIVRMFSNFNYGKPFPYFKSFWSELSEDEKRNGIEWARQQLNKRISGAESRLEVQSDRNVFSCLRQEHILEKSNRTKILICPHIFEEDSLQNGEFLFDNSYISWLTHLGDLSERTPDYEWYLKMHPAASKRDFIIMDKLLERYPRIRKLDSDISPRQLKDEGISVALTIGGTIAYEYPSIGIEVITCGNYPGISFNFAWAPKTVEEYDSLIMNAERILHKNNLEETYKFYAMRYLYYDWESWRIQLDIVDNKCFYMTHWQLRTIGLDNGTWKYKVYMDECTDKRHEQIMKSIPDILAKADSWRPDVFYKKKTIC